MAGVEMPGPSAGAAGNKDRLRLRALPGGRVIFFPHPSSFSNQATLNSNSMRATGVAVRTFQSPESPEPLKSTHSFLETEEWVLLSFSQR